MRGLFDMDVVNRKRVTLGWSLGIAAVTACVVSGGCSTFQGTTAKSFLNRIERSRDPNDRYLAYEKLGSERVYDNEQQKAEAVAVLASKLARKDPTRESWSEPAATRAMICRSLGQLKHPAARPAILSAISDSDVLVREQACRALGQVGTAEDATVLARVAAADSSFDCRMAAIEALGELKAPDPRINFFLANTMEGDDDPAVRFAALGSLRKITKKDFGVNPKPWHDYLVSVTPQPAAVGTTPPMIAGNPAPTAPPELPPLPTGDPNLRATSAPKP